ncbi:hypothetical protein [Actinoplanes sp. NPDC026623]|uniref:hypothetical protein n=1 Tax=Actinoplanes sp. NPDC026623 TaxID=3155610 RepID=UPI0033FE0888
MKIDPAVWRVTLVCADRKQHSRIKVGELHWFGGGFSPDKERVDEFDRPNARIVGTDGRSTERTANFFCVRCRRDFRLTRDQALRLADELGTARATRFDISLLT